MGHLYAEICYWVTAGAGSPWAQENAVYSTVHDGVERDKPFCVHQFRAWSMADCSDSCGVPYILRLSANM